MTTTNKVERYARDAMGIIKTFGHSHPNVATEVAEDRLTTNLMNLFEPPEEEESEEPDCDCPLHHTVAEDKCDDDVK